MLLLYSISDFSIKENLCKSKLTPGEPFPTPAFEACGVHWMLLFRVTLKAIASAQRGLCSFILWVTLSVHSLPPAHIFLHIQGFISELLWWGQTALIGSIHASFYRVKFCLKLGGPSLTLEKRIASVRTYKKQIPPYTNMEQINTKEEHINRRYTKKVFNHSVETVEIWQSNAPALCLAHSWLDRIVWHQGDKNN